jgi:hypothetical protein
MKTMTLTSLFLVSFIALFSCGNTDDKATVMSDMNVSENETTSETVETTTTEKSTWVDYSNEKAKYTAKFPKNPETKEVTTDNLKIYEAGYMDESNLYKVVAYLPLDESTIIGNSADYMNTMKVSLNAKYEILSESIDTFKNLPAILFKAKRNGWFFTRLMVVNQNYLYVLDVGNIQDFPSTEMTDDFYNAFAFN